MPKKRNYKEEYRKFQSSEKEKKNRAKRNKVRRKSGLKGRDKEIDHIKPLSKGGSNGKSNLRVVSRKTNRKKGKK